LEGRTVKTPTLSTSPRQVGPTPVGALTRGLIAGTAGTLAMDLLLYSRYRRDGGKDAFPAWELSAGVVSWEDAPAPAQVGRRLVEGVFQRELPDGRARLFNNVTHWVTGILAGAQYGLLGGSLRRPRVAYGVPFGAGVWATGYAVLPAAGLYQPIWKYDRVTLAKDLSAHLVFGLTTAAVFSRLLPKVGAPR
jgi:hypothetical protein